MKIRLYLTLSMLCFISSMPFGLLYGLLGRITADFIRLGSHFKELSIRELCDGKADNG
jgi:hypothetical protein